MDRAEFFDRMGDIAVFINERDNLNDHLSAICQGSFCEVGGRLLDSYVEILSMLMEDSAGWIDWFVYDNDMGNNAMMAGYDGMETRIRTLDDLWGLIEEGKRNEL